MLSPLDQGKVDGMVSWTCEGHSYPTLDNLTWTYNGRTFVSCSGDFFDCNSSECTNTSGECSHTFNNLTDSSFLTKFTSRLVIPSTQPGAIVVCTAQNSQGSTSVTLTVRGKS